MKLRAAGLQTVDVREPADFAGAHLEGSVNLGPLGTLAEWSGRILDPGRTTPLLLDVRPRRERKGGKAAAALAIPLEELPGRLYEVPRDREVVTVAAEEGQSSIAASLLERSGFGNVSDLVGGVPALEGSA